MMSSIALVWSFRSTEVMRTTGPQSKCGRRCLRTILENIGMHRISLAQASQDGSAACPDDGSIAGKYQIVYASHSQSLCPGCSQGRLAILAKTPCTALNLSAPSSEFVKVRVFTRRLFSSE